jgi:probable addiction module antidote protein
MNKNKSISYQDYLIESLKDKEEAIGYLNAALEGGDVSVFLLALQNVVQAHGGIAKVAQKTHKSRTSLYKTLSKRGNPYLETTNNILTMLGMHFRVEGTNSHKVH